MISGTLAVPAGVEVLLLWLLFGGGPEDQRGLGVDVDVDGTAEDVRIPAARGRHVAHDVVGHEVVEVALLPPASALRTSLGQAAAAQGQAHRDHQLHLEYSDPVNFVLIVFKCK